MKADPTWTNGRTRFGVIFDLDGLLVDSEPVQKMSFNAVLGIHGIVLSDDDFQPLVGHSTRCNFEDLKKRYEIDADVDDLLRRKAQAYENLIDSRMRPMPGAKRLVAELLSEGIPVAVASSSIRRDVEHSLEAVEMKKGLSYLVAGDEVSRSKPAPDLYLKAAEGLGFPPSRCIALEDSEAGVQAATAAGIQCIAVPNRYTRDQEFAEAIQVVDTLERITRGTLEAFLRT